MHKGWKILIIGGSAAVIVTAAYFIFKPKYSSKENSGSEGKGSGNSDSQTTNEKDNDSFPLKLGSKGDKVRKVRVGLGLTPTNVFDAETENKLYSMFKIKEITETQYNYVKILIKARLGIDIDTDRKSVV